MAKKSAGPKEAQLRAMRESKAVDSDDTVDAITKDLEAFEAKQKADRDAFLADKKKPLEDRIKLLKIDLSNAERALEKIEGKPVISKSGEPKGKRKNAAAKLEIAGRVYAHLKAAKKKMKPAEFEDVREGVAMPELFDKWNEANSDTPIEKDGERGAAVYFVG